MAIVPISQTVTPITSIPDRATQTLVEFDATATQFADQIQAMGADLTAWGGQANALAVAINLALNLGVGNSDFLRFVRSPGDIIHTAAAAAPVGTLVADGALVSRTTYADLFKALVTDAGFTATAFTATIANPAVFTMTGHGFTGGERLRLTVSSGGTLPSGLTSHPQDYWVHYKDANTFWLSAQECTDTLVEVTAAGTGTFFYTRSQWGLGDGTTTFNVPNLLNVFYKGSGPGRAVGTYQKGTLVGGDWDGAGGVGMVSIAARADLPYPPNRETIGADSPIVAAYTGCWFLANAPTSGVFISDREFYVGTTRPNNRALLPCVVY